MLEDFIQKALHSPGNPLHTIKFIPDSDMLFPYSYGNSINPFNGIGPSPVRDGISSIFGPLVRGRALAVYDKRAVKLVEHDERAGHVLTQHEHYETSLQGI